MIRPFHPTVVQGLLEIDPHDDLQPVAQGLAQGDEAPGVVQRRSGIVDGAGADDDGETVVGATQDIVEGVAGAEDCARGRVCTRMLAHDLDRRGEGFYLGDAKVVGGLEHLVVSSGIAAFWEAANKKAASDRGRLASGLVVSL